METTALRKFLKGLCDGSGWDYAIFWKLWHQIPSILSLEECYYNQSMPPDNSSGTLYFDRYNGFLNDEITTISETSIQYHIGVLMEDMSSLQYMLGEGLIGEVACTDNYCWVSPEDFSASQYGRVPSQLSEELLPHFLSGMKTMLLVSVHPYGVFQLGSCKDIPEDEACAKYIKETFIENYVCSGFMSSDCIQDEDRSLHSQQSLDVMNDPITSSIISIMEDKVLHEESPKDNEETNESNVALIFSSLQEIFEDLEDKQLIHSALGLSGVQNPPNDEPLEFGHPMAQNMQFSMSYLGEDFPEFPDGIVTADSYFPCDIVTEHCGDYEDYVEHQGREMFGSLFNTQREFDLFEALGTSLRGKASDFVGTEALLAEIRDFSECIESPTDQDSKESDAKVKAEDLLEAVVAEFAEGPDGSSPNSSLSHASWPALAVPCVSTTSGQSLKKSKKIFVGGGDDSAIWDDLEVAYAMRNTNSSSKHSKPASSRSTVSSLTEQEQPKDGQKYQLSGSKRKAGSGDGQKPRPRDRQLIQDRVKELRELVPNGSKCSIDALLDRTVKHMHFLRSVTNQAEKLRKCVPPKETKPKIWQSLGIDEEDCGKRGWAFDFGGEFQVFPIVLEDLEYPGQMLIEMMCDEQGLFLEIAQVLKRLELTILKGVLENRSSNTWARFVVEASKGFQRTEIFWPLMQVLQQRQGKPVLGTA